MADRRTYTSIPLWRKLRPAAREMRTLSTDAEALLWEQLRNRRLDGIRFRRQHPIGRFIADFCAPGEDLIVELDGTSHRGRAEEDAARQTAIEALGYRVVRFSNTEVEQQLDRVIATIRQSIVAKR